MSKQKNVPKETKEICDSYELAELRFKMAYIRYKIEKWKQGKENQEEKIKSKQ